MLALYTAEMRTPAISILFLGIHHILELLRDAVLNTLMWPVFVEEGDVLIKNMLQSAQAEDDEVIQALLPETANPAFSKSIGVWCLQRCVDGFDASTLQ